MAAVTAGACWHDVPCPNTSWLYPTTAVSATRGSSFCTAQSGKDGQQVAATQPGRKHTDDPTMALSTSAVPRRWLLTLMTSSTRPVMR